MSLFDDDGDDDGDRTAFAAFAVSVAFCGPEADQTPGDTL